MKFLFKFLLLVAAVVLSYMCVESIMKPIRFGEAKVARDEAVISRLVDIRKAQVEYLKANPTYAVDFDSLVLFVKTAKVARVQAIGTLSDDQLEAGLTEKKAVAIVNKGDKEEIAKNGLENFRRDTTFVSLLEDEDIFGGRTDFVPDSLPFVPGTGVRFELAIDSVKTASGMVEQLFEAKTPYDVYLGGLDKQEIINLKDVVKEFNEGVAAASYKYAGLKVGSVAGVNNNAGNWE